MEKITLKLFWIFMIVCAGSAVVGIWFEDKLPEAFFKAIGTCFVLGLANFLLWAPTVTYRFISKS